MPLEEAYLEILRMAAEQPYQIGCFRPDFVINEVDEVRICEINARFSANGFRVSYLIDAALGKTRYLNGHEKAPSRIPALQSIDACLTSNWKTASKIALVLTNETAGEMTSLLGQLPFHQIHPSRLRPGEYDRVILEMDRRDLLLLPKPGLRWMIETHCVRNDLRTNILVHDKRLLSILCDTSIMVDYLAKDQVALLEEYIIPTFAANNPEARAKALETPQNWVLKPSSGGRGVDTHIGSLTPPADWSHILESRSEAFVLQPFVSQKTWPVTCLEQGRLQTKLMNVVGLLPCFNDQYFGPGIFRTGSNAIINVHQKRGEILPSSLEGFS